MHSPSRYHTFILLLLILYYPSFSLTYTTSLSYFGSGRIKRRNGSLGWRGEGRVVKDREERKGSGGEERVVQDGEGSLGIVQGREGRIVQDKEKKNDWHFLSNSTFLRSDSTFFISTSTFLDQILLIFKKNSNIG